MKRTVYGFVGPEALPKPLPSSAMQSTLKALRNHVEDCIEGRFDVFANLAISDSGSVHAAFTGDANPEENQQLLAYAVQCTSEFVNQKI